MAIPKRKNIDSSAPHYYDEAADSFVPASDSTPLPTKVTSSTLPTGAATEAKQGTIIGHIDGIETLLTAIEADTSTLSDVIDTPEYFEDTSFVTGDSPVTLDLNTALGRNATTLLIINDGAGNFTYQLSTDGSVFGDAITMKSGEFKQYEGLSIDSVRITWVSNSAYRVEAI